MATRRPILAAFAWLVMAAICLAAPPTIWRQEAERVLRPEQLKNGASAVDDAQASGGKAIRIPWQKEAKDYFNVHLGIDPVTLQAKNVFTLHLRGENMLPISHGMTVYLIAHDRAAGTRVQQSWPVYGVNLKPQGYTPVALTLETALRPAACLVEIAFRWEDQPEAAAPVLSLDKIEIQPQALEQPIIREVLPGKARFLPKARASARVKLYNPLDKGLSVVLQGEDVADLGLPRPAFEQAVSLEPREEKEVACQWELDDKQYGHELAVRLLVDGKQVDRASECFAVCDTPLWLSVSNGYDRAQPHRDMHTVFYVQPAAVRESARAVRFWRQSSPGAEYWEFFSWAPGDMSDLAPADDVFPGGEGPLCYRSRETVRKQTELLRQAGMWPVSYVNGTCWAESGYRLFARHPEWFIFDDNGECAHYEMDRRELYQRKDSLDFNPESYAEIFFQGVLNTAIPAVQEYVARQYIRCGKEMGFKGVRMDVRYLEVHPGERDFDGKVIAPTTEQADRISAATVKRVKELVHREIPDFTFGYNYGSPEEVQDMPLTMQERCAGAAWILDELPCTYQEKNSPYRLWPAYLRRMTWWGDQVQRWGGVYNPYDFRRSGPNYAVDKLYSAIFRLIAGGRCYNSGYFYDSRLPSGDLGRLATRYSEVFFGKNRRWIADVKDTVEVKAAAAVWWKDTVFWNTNQEGRRQLLVHLVNPPKSMEVEGDPLSQINPPVLNVEVACAPAEGALPRSAWLLTAEPSEPTEAAEVRLVELPLKPAAGGRVSVAVPPVIFWKIVLFQY